MADARHQPGRRPPAGQTLDEPGTNGLVVPRPDRTGFPPVRGDAAATGWNVYGAGRQFRARSSGSRLTLILHQPDTI